MSPGGAAALVVLGLVLLAAGGESLVRGAVSIARLARVPPTIIGLTIVAMGTSLPELVVSLLAALRGNADVAVGGVVGSNIFNVAAILGIAALLVPLGVHGNAVRLKWPFMFVASVIALLLARDGRIDRLEGGFFVVSLALFLTYVVRLARADVGAAEAAELNAAVAALTIRTRVRGAAVDTALVLFGCAVLAAGAHWLVQGAVALAALAGWSERVVGLTIVAAGTSLPELATSLVAAYRRHAGVALANIIGSNIFNVLGILGITALVHPLTVAPAIVRVDLWWMIAVSLALFPLMWSGMRISRIEGAALLAAYTVYLRSLF